MPNLTLHELSNELSELLSQVDPDTGELPAELGEVRALVERKAGAVAAYVANVEATAEAIAEFAKRKAAEAKALQRRAAWLRGYLADHMVTTGLQRITADGGALTITAQPWRDKSIEVYDADAVPQSFKREKITLEVDKTAIRASIDHGLEVTGARLVTKHRLTIK